MQNTLPMDIVMPNVQAANINTGAATGNTAETSDSKGFSEAMGNAVEQTNQQTTNDNTTKDKTVQNAGEQTEQKPKDDVGESEEVDAAEAVIPPAIGMINIQQTIANLLIGKAEENQVTEGVATGDLQMNDQTVDVLEGLQLQDNEAGIENVADMPRNDAQPAQQEGDAEAWMPDNTDSSMAKQPIAQQGAKPSQPVDVEQEIETRLQEHLSPLDNLNGSPETEITNTKSLETDIDIDFDIDTQLKPAENEQDIDETATQASPRIDAEAEPVQTQAQLADDGEGQAEEGTQQAKAEIKPKAERIKTERPKTEQPKAESFQKEHNIGLAKTEAQPMAQPKAEQVEESIFNRMVDNITTNAQQGKREFSINLRPDFMGDMSIELVMTEAGLSAKIRTGSDQVNNMISQHLFKLEQSLKDQGIDVASLEVSVFDTGDFSKGDFNSNNPANSFKPGGGKQHRLGRISSMVSDSAMIMETLNENQMIQPMGLGSSVEYIA